MSAKGLMGGATGSFAAALILLSHMSFWLGEEENDLGFEERKSVRGFCFSALHGQSSDPNGWLT
jgi:hypothetical protein